MKRKTIGLSDELYDYVLSVSLRERDVLARLREETSSHPHGRMQIAPDQGQLMALLVRAIGARSTIEVGVFTGYSSLAVALALPDDGQIVACDVSEDYTSIARRYWKEAGVEGKIDLRIAPAVDTLQGLIDEGREGSFDFAFIDADKVNYANYYELCLRLLRSGGLIAVDNVLWSGRVADSSESDPDTSALRAFNEKVRDDERVHLSMIPVADGLTLAMKK